MAKKEEKTKLILASFSRHEKDNGSEEIQIALLTDEISSLADHLRVHPHDFSSKRGLILKVAQRKKLLRYLSQFSWDRYEKVVKALGL